MGRHPYLLRCLSIPGDDSDEKLPSKRAKGLESTSSHKCGSNYGKHFEKDDLALLRISKPYMMSPEKTHSGRWSQTSASFVVL